MPHLFKFEYPEELRLMRVLVVDDESVNTALIEGLLGQAGFYQVRSVLDAREAREAYREWRPDLVLLDLMMPWVDGYTVLEQIRAEAGAEVFLPVMVLTADVSESARRRALAAGATDFLTKPINHTECLLRIGNMLTTRRLHLQLAAQNAVLEERVRQRTKALEGALMELRSAQQQIVQRERLSALGAMVSGIAHDFNNSLALILGYGERLQRECQAQRATGVIPECAQTIITAAADAAEMVSRLRRFQRPAEPGDARVPVRLGEIVDQTIAFTRPRWHAESVGRGSPIECRSELADAKPIPGNPAELREMLTNLIFNAVEAMPQGGSIVVRVAMLGNRVQLRVQDHGTGMVEEVKRRCFEPFFTTRGRKAAGLGLAMVYGIVQRHQGTVQIDSTLGRGTTFSFTFPADESGESTSQVEPPQVQRPLRILVAEDQPVFLGIVAEMLRRDWHSVTTAPDGATALEHFKAGDFDLVITDQAMPQMSGDQLAAAVKARSPEVPVLMLTGFAAPGADPEAKSEFVDAVLTKPTTSEGLRMAVFGVTSEGWRRKNAGIATIGTDGSSLR